MNATTENSLPRTNAVRQYENQEKGVHVALFIMYQRSKSWRNVNFGSIILSLAQARKRMVRLSRNDREGAADDEQKH